MMRRRKLTAPERKHLFKIQRAARTAARLRLQGKINHAMGYDRRLDSLIAYAERRGFARAAALAEERGRKRADRLTRYHEAHGRSDPRPRGRRRRDPSWPGDSARHAEAARKGWARRKAGARPVPKPRRARNRSEAARKGWIARRARALRGAA